MVNFWSNRGRRGLYKDRGRKIDCKCTGIRTGNSSTATAQSNGNPYGEYPVTIHKRNLDHEKFDTITLIGANSIDAGSSESYSFTAIKNGIDVTETLAAEDVVWNIMDSTGARLLGNKYITVDNGTVTVSNGVIGQDIRVRAATEDGYVYGEIDVTINNNSSETIVQYDACEKKVEENKALVYQGSWGWIVVLCKKYNR